MIQRRIVRRYAAALFVAASRADVVDRVESDLGLVSYAMESSSDLRSSLASPLVAPDTKKAIMRDLFVDRVHETTLKYLTLVVDKRREEALIYTEREYILFANEARGVVEAEVHTALHITEDQSQRLQARLSIFTGKRVNLVKIVRPELIGGVMIKIGDEVIDGSIKGRLSDLKKAMLA